MVLRSKPRARRANVRQNDPRLRVWNDKPVRSGEYVVYWCQASRRPDDNVALEYAIKRANELSLPVVVYESVRPDYPYASDRLHTFLLECARDTAERLTARGIQHGFFLPRTADEARGVAAQVFARAALVVSDDHPSFVYPWQNAAGARRAPCTYVTIDDAAIAPLALIPAHEPNLRAIRPKLFALLEEWLAPVVPIAPKVEARAIEWPFEPVDLLRADLGALVARCEIDHGVAPVEDRPGGYRAARERLASFLSDAGPRYHEGRDDHGLSPYLHFGAISARACVLAAARAALPSEAWDVWVDQLVVRRGLAFNHAAREPRHAMYEGVPEWARETLAAHAKDARPNARPPSTLEKARSVDPVWNAAMRELLQRGRIHEVVRRYWGKRAVALVKRPRDAFDFLVRALDKYALDGRDPVTYATIGWCFGLHDRPFPERKIYGAVRTMGLTALRKRFDVDAYVDSAPPPRTVRSSRA